MQTRRSILQSLFATAALSAASTGRASCTSATPSVVEFFFEGGLNARQTFMVSADSAHDPDRYQIGLSSAYAVNPVPMYDRQTVTSYKRTNALDELFTKQVPFRLLELSHDLEPHEAAIPYAFTGTTLGRPQHAGTGVFAHDQCAATSVILDSSSLAPTPPTLRALGEHDASHAPLVVRFGSWGVGNTALLQRQGDPDFDRLLEHYDMRYGERLKPQGRARVASDAYDAYAASLQHLLGLDANIATALTNPGGSTRVEIAYNTVKELLSTTTVRYVAVILDDFDTHGRHGADSVDHHNSELDELVTLIATNRQTALGDALIALTTEFGRRTTANDLSDHDPSLYGNLIIPPVGAGVDGSYQVADRIDGKPWRPFDLRAYLLSHFGLSDQDVVAALGSYPDGSNVELTTARVAAITAALTT